MIDFEFCPLVRLARVRHPISKLCRLTQCQYNKSIHRKEQLATSRVTRLHPGAKTINKNTNSTQNKSETHRAKQYEVTSFLSTDCELSTETCSKNIYSLGPKSQ